MEQSIEQIHNHSEIWEKGLNNFVNTFNKPKIEEILNGIAEKITIRSEILRLNDEIQEYIINSDLEDSKRFVLKEAMILAKFSKYLNYEPDESALESEKEIVYQVLREIEEKLKKNFKKRSIRVQ